MRKFWSAVGAAFMLWFKILGLQRQRLMTSAISSRGYSHLKYSAFPKVFLCLSVCTAESVRNCEYFSSLSIYTVCLILSVFTQASVALSYFIFSSGHIPCIYDWIKKLNGFTETNVNILKTIMAIKILNKYKLLDVIYNETIDSCKEPQCISSRYVLIRVLTF